MQSGRGRLSHQQQNEGYRAAKGQRVSADEVLVRLVDVKRAGCLSEVGKAAQEGYIMGQEVSHSPNFGSRLMP